MRFSEAYVLAKAGYSKKDVEQMKEEEKQAKIKEEESKKAEEIEKEKLIKAENDEKENKIKELEKELEELRKNNLNKDISGDDESFEDKLNDSLNALI